MCKKIKIRDDIYWISGRGKGSSESLWAPEIFTVGLICQEGLSGEMIWREELKVIYEKRFRKGRLLVWYCEMAIWILVLGFHRVVVVENPVAIF